MAPTAAPSESSDGLLIVGHGTRDPVGCEEFLTTANSVAARLAPMVVEPCFLELAEPTIDSAVARLASCRIDRLSVLPLLLFAAGHAKEDIPSAVGAAIDSQALSLASKAIELQLPHLGCHAKLIELSQLRFLEAIGDRSKSGRTTLVMVGRGSRDADATAEMRRFARLLSGQTPITSTEVCFVAMAEPPIQQCLDDVAKNDTDRVVVQPHLLFGGQLLARIAGIVCEMAERYPEKEWIVTRHLGPHALLTGAMEDLVTSSLRSG